MPNFYTILLEREGFPVLYICPECGRLSEFAPFSFETPQEACLRFLDDARSKGSEVWEYEPDIDVLVRAFVKNCSIFGVIIGRI